jgi:hypothetical protein
VTFTLQLPAEMCIGKLALLVSVDSGTFSGDPVFKNCMVMSDYGSSAPKVLFHI